MKINPKTTKLDRLRVVIGALLSLAGVAAIVILGALHGYGHNTIWIAGVLLIVSGLFIAKSVEIANFLSDLLR